MLSFPTLGHVLAHVVHVECFLSVSATESSCPLIIILQCQKLIFCSEVLIEAGYSKPD